MTERVHDWPERLVAFVAEREGEAFAWGENDCALFVADWVREARGGGEDPAGAYRFRYQDRDGAISQLVTNEDSEAPELELDDFTLGGFAQLLCAAVTRELGAPLVSPRLAQRGDVVALRDDRVPAEIVLAVCTGVHAVALDVALGLVRRPAGDALLAWRV